MNGRHLTSLLCALTIGAGCEAKTARTGDTVAVVLNATEDVKRFQDASERKITELEGRIARAREGMKDKSAEARAKSEEGINKMEIEVRELRARVREAKYDTKDGWDRFTAEVDNALERLGKSIDEALR